VHKGSARSEAVSSDFFSRSSYRATLTSSLMVIEKSEKNSVGVDERFAQFTAS